MSLELLAELSVAVTVMMLEPEAKAIPDTLQELSVRVAEPEPPLSLAEVTFLRPLPPASSAAEPLRLRVLVVVG